MSLNEKLAQLAGRQAEEARRKKAVQEAQEADRLAREQVRQSVQASWSVNMQVLTEAIDRVNSALSQHGKPLYLIAEQKSDSDRVYKGKIGYTRKPFPFDDGDMQRILMVVENNGDINFKLGTKSSFPR